MQLLLLLCTLELSAVGAGGDNGSGGEGIIDVTFARGPMGLYLMSGPVQQDRAEAKDLDFPGGVWVTGFAKDVATGSIYEAEKSGRVQVGDELVAVGGTVLSSDPTRIHRDTGTATRLIREHGYPVTITFQRCAKVPLAEAHEGALEDVATAGDRCAWSHLLRSAEAIRNNSTTIASEELGFAEELMQQGASRGPRTSPVESAG